MDREKFARRRAKWESRRTRRCQRGPERGIVFGALIVGIGLLSLLANIGIVMIHDVWSCWPLAIVALGVTTGLRSSRHSVLVLASLLSAAGSLLLLRNLDVFAFDFHMIWPVVIIGFGLAKLAELLDPPREMASK
jgi:hypothetical protein